MTTFRRGELAAVFLLAVSAVIMCAAQAQQQIPWADAHGPLDPSRAIAQPVLVKAWHTPLPEQYIWTAGDAAALQDEGRFVSRDRYAKTQPHCFRATFALQHAPATATLYLAGPRSARVWLNGALVGEFHSNTELPMVFTTISVDLGTHLRRGANVLAVEAVRGWGVQHHTNSELTAQLNFGEILAAKIVPADPGVAAAPILISNAAWKSVVAAGAGWQQPGFDDESWPSVQSLGSIEGNLDFFQWNADAGLYAWPGYVGESPYLANYRMLPLHSTLQPGKPADVLLDFGREVAGRIEFTSGSDHPLRLTVQYGESQDEASEAPYLGADPILVPPYAKAYGPKSAFRYVLVRLPEGVRMEDFRTVAVDGTYYPARYRGAFRSSDEQLNRIWETAAYTVHLAMQDSLWDAPKRDRGRWMGDMEVENRSIDAVFADSRLSDAAFDSLIGPAPVTGHVNTLPGYSAFWMIGEAENYLHYGDRAQLEAVRPRMIQLLNVMDREIDAKGCFANRSESNTFVDWSPGFSQTTPESMRAMQFEYLLAYRKAGRLLHQLGDTSAVHWEQRADLLQSCSQTSLLDRETQTFGPHWQTNAMAVLSGAATPSQQQAIWDRVLSQPGQQITPYYACYLIEAMAATGRTKEALRWIRDEWGGMLAEGATSFWEAYDPRGPKVHPHASLQADGKTGFYVSLAHGWSSGAAAWLTEHILGVRAVEPGYRRVRIEPDLAGLAWATGIVPTPRGDLHLDLRQVKGKLSFDCVLPTGIDANVSLPATAGENLLVNGISQHATRSGDGNRLEVLLTGGRRFRVEAP